MEEKNYIEDLKNQIITSTATNTTSDSLAKSGDVSDVSITTGISVGKSDYSSGVYYFSDPNIPYNTFNYFLDPSTEKTEDEIFDFTRELLSEFGFKPITEFTDDVYGWTVLGFLKKPVAEAWRFSTNSTVKAAFQKLFKSDTEINLETEDGAFLWDFKVKILCQCQGGGLVLVKDYPEYYLQDKEESESLLNTLGKINDQVSLFLSEKEKSISSNEDLMKSLITSPPGYFHTGLTVKTQGTSSISSKGYKNYIFKG